MPKINMTAANLFKWVAWGQCTVYEIHGWNNQASSVYIQLHEAVPPAPGTGNLANATVPNVKSLVATANNGFMYQFGAGLTLTQLFIAMSTTETSLTAVAANGGLDVTFVVDSDFLTDGTEVVVGDTTTTVRTLQVWAEASGPFSLKRVDVTEQLGAARFVCIQQVDVADSTNQFPDLIFQITANQTRNYNFGQQGLRLRGSKVGCTIRESDVVPVVFPGSNNSLTIRAIYK